jgi:hypothetical protein
MGSFLKYIQLSFNPETEGFLRTMATPASGTKQA